MESLVTIDAEPSARTDDPLAMVEAQVALATARGGAEFDPIALKITLLLHRVMGKFEAEDTAEFSREKLSAQQFNVLVVVDRAERALTMQHISKVISVRPTRLTSVADALCHRGFVTREMNSADRRSFYLRITERGHEFLADFLPKHWSRMRGQMDCLSHQEQQSLTTLLGKLLVASHPD